jgi:hypothetical protein
MNRRGRTHRTLLLGGGALSLWLVAACTPSENNTGPNTGPDGSCPVGQNCEPPSIGSGGDPINPGQYPGGSRGNTRLPCNIQTFFSERCGTCHNENLDFGAPMALVSWEDLHAAAPITTSQKVYEAVLSRIDDDNKPMPPIQFPRVNAAEREMLQDWIDQGAPARAAGETCESDPPIEFDGGTGLPDASTDDESDYEVEQSGGPDDCETYYEFRAHGGEGEDDRTPFKVAARPLNSGNQYHCFYLKPPYNAEDQGLWFAPIIDNKKVLHHWLLYGTDLMTQASGSSSPCTAAQPGNYLIAGWAPGTPETNFPVDVGLQMPTSGLILELHYYNATGVEQEDRSGVKYCTARKGTRKHTAAVHFTGSEGICLPPNSQHTVEGICDPADNQEIHLVNLWPHLHTHGRRMKLEVVKDVGLLAPSYQVVDVLHDKPFDFENQITYPLNRVLKPGELLRTTCYYENTTNQRVPFGEQTQEEMCYGFIVAWPAGALVTDPAKILFNPIDAIGQGLQPARRCLNPTAIFDSCNGLLDYPLP